MKKIMLGALLLLGISMANAQEMYLKTGKNYTTYNYKSDTGNALALLAGSGDFYELGYVMTLNNEKLKYAIGLALNEHNAMGGDMANSYAWNTQYLGLQNTFSIAFVNNNGFEVSANGGLGLATLIYGKQDINGYYVDLASQKEFSGFWVSPKLGLQAAYHLDNDLFLSLGYAFEKSFNLTNSSSEKLDFTTNQIQFGLHIKLR
jgi:hypothetical protein